MERDKIIWAITGTRAEYGLMRNTFLCIKNTPGLRLKLIVTGMHLMEEFGKTENEIRNDKFDFEILDVRYDKDTKESMTSFLGRLVEKLADKVSNSGNDKPDFILLLGDRAEMLAGAIAGTYLSIPVVHIHGGDLSGHVDNPVRHAITKLAHIHFAVTEKSARRIIKMGEEPWRVMCFGAPQLDDIMDFIGNKKIPDRKDFFKRMGMDPCKKTILVIQHPVLTEFSDAARQMEETLGAVKEACDRLDMQAVVVYPNADAGGRKMIEVIKRHESNLMKSFPSLRRNDYISLMNYSEVMVGNSSSGIIESPAFCLPAVDIGTRQEVRERDCNIIHSSYGKRAILSSIFKAMKKSKNLKCKNIYGKGHAGGKIAAKLLKIKTGKKLIGKKMTY